VTAPIFHIADEADWYRAAAIGAYTRSTRGLSLDDVGFIHCSYEHQVDGVAHLIYADTTTPLLLLTIDPERVSAPIQVDDGFPHIYGPLNADAVTEVRPFHVS
jgi:glutathione S-transferase